MVNLFQYKTTPSPIIIIFILSVTLFACGESGKKPESYNENRDLVPDPEGYKKDTIISSLAESTKNKICDFDTFLNDPKTPKLAKELYYNTYKLKDTEPGGLFKKLKTKDFRTRQFYFRVITNSYKISDGAYSYILGCFGDLYIRENTVEFAEYFDNKICFSDKDLETWAKIVILSFASNGDEEYNKSIIDRVIRIYEPNCWNCSPSQKETIRKFCKILKIRWQDKLKSKE